MSAAGTRQGLLLASLCLVCASAFTAYEFLRFRQSSRNLASRRGDMTLAQLPPVPAATVTAQQASTPKDASAISSRLQLLIKNADKGPGGVPLVHPEDLFVDHPALERAFLDAMRGRARLKYGPYFALAGLNAQEIESFCQIYVDSETRWTELNKLAFERGIERSDPSITAMERKSSEERKARLAALLGEERSAKLQQFQDEDGARRVLLGLNNLVATTYRTNNPVTPAQINALVGIANEFQIFSPIASAGIPDAFDQAERRAAKILTPDQMEIFNLILDNQQVGMLRYLEYRSKPDKP